MAKKKTEYLPNVNAEHYFLIKRNILVYPVFYEGKWYIVLNANGKIKQFDKSVNQSEINLSIHKTIKYAYERIVNNCEICLPF
jgi:hypothetical protein